MAFGAFLKIDGIPGESADEKHKDWIEIPSHNKDVPFWGIPQRLEERTVFSWVSLRTWAIRFCVVISGFLLTGGSASAQVHLGVGGGLTSDNNTFHNGMLTLYGDYIHPSSKPLTWVTGVEWTYATTSSDTYPIRSTKGEAIS